MLNPKQAYEKARIEGPSDSTRNAVLFSPEHSYLYALYIDECSRDDTRQAVLSSVIYSYLYAVNADKGPREDTSNAVLSSPEDSYWYALHIDKNIFIDSNDYHYFVDIYNIGMKHIRRHRCDIGFMSMGCFCLDVL